MEQMYYIGLDVHKKKISYCGLCIAEKSSADVIKRCPLSKQRNKHLQCTLICQASSWPRLANGCLVLL
jgi:hypothetical protein